MSHICLHLLHAAVKVQLFPVAMNLEHVVLELEGTV